MIQEIQKAKHTEALNTTGLFIVEVFVDGFILISDLQNQSSSLLWRTDRVTSSTSCLVKVG